MYDLIEEEIATGQVMQRSGLGPALDACTGQAYMTFVMHISATGELNQRPNGLVVSQLASAAALIFLSVPPMPSDSLTD